MTNRTRHLDNNPLLNWAIDLPPRVVGDAAPAQQRTLAAGPQHRPREAAGVFVVEPRQGAVGGVRAAGGDQRGERLDRLAGVAQFDGTEPGGTDAGIHERDRQRGLVAAPIAEVGKVAAVDVDVDVDVGSLFDATSRDQADPERREREADVEPLEAGGMRGMAVRVGGLRRPSGRAETVLRLPAGR